ncbi:MAG: LruC domain-containing protein [Prevotellaceae bacterium]|jgi:hypothetical protein|nr:LruC domain-containing protein [Prevotellaceae bacterium]
MGLGNGDAFDPSKAKDFSLTRSVSVKVQMPTEGTRCLIFTEYPYDEHMTIQALPVLIGYSPIDKVLNVPKASKKLYMLANGKVTEFTNTNISFQEVATKVTTRAAGDGSVIDFGDALYTYVWNYYPDNELNIPDDKRQVCTDLKITEPTTVKISYVAGINGITNDLYWYKYQKDGDNYPTTVPTGSDLHHLYNDPGNGGVGGSSAGDPAVGSTIELGDFDAGDYIGFAIKPENSSNYKYSTPAFNQIIHPGSNYGTQGVIRKIDFDGKEYILLGMEDTYGRGSDVGGSDGETAWADGDFNDMLCIITANPIENCNPENEIDPPTIGPETVYENGMWLFEDNYPKQGDYDFNDVVVKYRIEIKKGESTAKAYLDFAATGASFHNNFGINGKWLITDGTLTGYKNVYAGKHVDTQEILFTGIPIEMVSAEDASGATVTVPKFIPMLDNGNHTFDLETYNKHDYEFPNAFQIPTLNFKWCLESKRIDLAYAGYSAWVESGCSDELAGWYLGAVDESLVYTNY